MDLRSGKTCRNGLDSGRLAVTETDLVRGNFRTYLDRVCWHAAAVQLRGLRIEHCD